MRKAQVQNLNDHAFKNETTSTNVVITTPKRLCPKNSRPMAWTMSETYPIIFIRIYELLNAIEKKDSTFFIYEVQCAWHPWCWWWYFQEKNQIAGSIGDPDLLRDAL